MRFLDFVIYEENNNDNNISDKIYYYRAPITLMNDNQNLEECFIIGKIRNIIS